VCTEGCAVSGPYSAILILTAADTEGHFPGGWYVYYRATHLLLCLL